MNTSATNDRSERGELRLFNFDSKINVYEDDLLKWFWDGYTLVAYWLTDTSINPAFYELPKVQAFLRHFALLANDVFHKTLDAEKVYAFLQTCEETHDAIREYYHRPRS